MYSESHSETIRCASCGDGPFIRSVLDITYEHDRVIDGYYFCAWCDEYTDEETLLERAEDMVVTRLPVPEE